MNSTLSIPTQQQEQRQNRYPKAVRYWLAIGVFMVIMQVVIGGITRLTGSGLSITRWEIVTGTLPPLNAAQWEEAFDLYKDTPQYQKINEGMSMGEFKFIYFWEYFHRLWARTMGLVFAIPFFIFWKKGYFDRMLFRRLLVVVGMAAIVASFGWIMVASGLVERPLVNAYKLTMHLSLALTLFGYLLWTTFKVFQPNKQVFHRPLLKQGALVLAVLLGLQIALGGVVAGMKAALFYPTWPDMNGQLIPPILLDASAWNWQNFVEYDSSPFMSALVQFLHRGLAYLLTFMTLAYFIFGLQQSPTRAFRIGLYLVLVTLIVQVSLGILTVINSVGAVPVNLGVLHQGVAIILLGSFLFLLYQFRGTTASA